MNLTLRHETRDDYHPVEEMTRDAFWNQNVPGCDEHYLVHLMRKHRDFIPDLSFVALLDDVIVGNIMYTRSYVVDTDGQSIDTLTFGPLTVRPGYQRQGIGTALVEHTKKLATERGEKAIIILGEPFNYCTHGFKNTKDFNITDGEGRFPYGQLVYELEKGTFDGRRYTFHYSDLYDSIDANALDEYDVRFPAREKEYRYTQELFSISVRAYL